MEQRMAATSRNLMVAGTGSLESRSTITYESASEQSASEKGMTLTARMHDNPISKRQGWAWNYSGRGSFRGGFSICLVIVVLSVFGWVMHRRLSQYDAPQQAIHQSAAIKVCLTERNPMSVPSTHGMDAAAVFLLALAFIATFNSPGNSEASLTFRVQRDQSDQRADAGILPSLDHFFFLPPPSRQPVL
jgi:hypothetical protein